MEDFCAMHLFWTIGPLHRQKLLLASTKAQPILYFLLTSDIDMCKLGLDKCHQHANCNDLGKILSHAEGEGSPASQPKVGHHRL